MTLIVNEELKAYIDPLTPDEYESLERSLLTEGCRDALVLWGDTLVDGHNRHGICQKHGLPFQTVQNTRFQSIEDVHLWMIDQHLGRRSVSDFQRGVLALRKRAIVAERRALLLASAGQENRSDSDPSHGVTTSGPASALPDPDPLKSRDAIARAARITNSQVVMIEKIQKQAAPELVAAVKSGAVSINAAAVVATLPADEQVAAAMAGKDGLRQAAKRVREAQRQAREETPQDGTAPDQLQLLQQRVAELTRENEDLRGQLALLRAAH
jgi:hypothetical protein